MTNDERKLYRTFREAGYGAIEALDNARAIVKGREAGLVCTWIDEDEAWDGDGEAPRYLLCGVVHREGDDGTRLASLNMVGVESFRDVYLLDCEAQLMVEALDLLDSENDSLATALASELAARATYAGVQS